MQKTKVLQNWDARVHLTRDLKRLNQHDELYLITWSKWLKNGILKKWVAPFVYPQIFKKMSFFEKNEKNENKSHEITF